ncbi:tripartite tricarboxylate transporter substrate binding protein [Roseomonas sp. AR75]|uniref:Bug family tripartite tricarboxylate transporter substrate binding protein n=1 Tax=Roseomonas sp. AR75 TaxID=2562311 RepID=UPI0010C03E36|nr:tripartite tricarboxylate transporter substrate binding protein [Roseomonas sp. AR75]
MIQRRMLLAAAAATLAAPRAMAWPDRQVRLLVGFAPGGAVDTVARLIAGPMGETLGQSVVVENRPGASANIAAAALVSSPADGHTVLMGAFAHGVNPSLINLGYDLRELKPVLQLTRVPTVLIVHKDSPWQSAAELVAAGKAKPEGLTYASGGAGTASHLAPELFVRRVGMKATHVPFRGGAPAMQAVMGRQVDFMCENPQPAFMAAGSPIRPLAVFRTTRLPLFPDVPAITEAGFGAGLTINSWHGLFVRNGAPDEAIQRIVAAAQAAMARPEVRTRIESLTIEPVESSPAAFAAFFADQVETWGKVVREAGISVQ